MGIFSSHNEKLQVIIPEVLPKRAAHPQWQPPERIRLGERLATGALAVVGSVLSLAGLLLKVSIIGTVIGVSLLAIGLSLIVTAFWLVFGGRRRRSFFCAKFQVFPGRFNRN